MVSKAMAAVAWLALTKVNVVWLHRKIRQ